ncbi:MAG: Rrf2 family transcriptional regulator [Phycisphaerales bacterium]
MISQTIEYALRAMTHLASQPAGSTVSSEQIAECTKVPRGYLSKVLRDLVVANLITSQRGPSGGFSLAREPDAISILDVVNAVDPIQRIHKCPLGKPDHIALCPLHSRLNAALGRIEKEFAETSFTELLGDAISKRGCKALSPISISAKLPAQN